MRMESVEAFIQTLMEDSTLRFPAWNIEKKRQGKEAGWDYIDGCMMYGFLRYYEKTKNEAVLNFCKEYVGDKISEDGSILKYSPEEKNLDHINAGKNLFTLYDLTGEEKFKKALDLIYSQIDIQPRTASGNFWHKDIYPNQVWLDGLYMVMPFYAEYAKRYLDNKEEKFEDIYKQFFFVEDNIKDPVTGLYYHANDTSKEMFWCDKETGNSQHFWLRASGWFSMSMLDTLVIMEDKESANYKRLENMYKNYIESICKFQDESGMWYQVVDQVGREGNYLETSGSSILSYCLLKGVRLGILDKKYEEKGIKAFNGICNERLREVDGRISLGGICLVAGLGGKDNRDGSYEYYLSEPIVENDAKGTGPFLFAYTEMLYR